MFNSKRVKLLENYFNLRLPQSTNIIQKDPTEATTNLIKK